MRNQKNLFLLSLLLISFVISEGIFFQNNAFAITFRLPICVPLNEPDPETGCRACGDNKRTEYEQCRQVYYLKKQTEILASQQSSKNQELQGLLDSQQKQIKELIQQIDSQNQKINTSTTSLRNSNILNISLVVIIGIFLICLISIFIKKIWKKKLRKF